MIRMRCLKCGQPRREGEGHSCPNEAKEPFDEKAWKRDYMRGYMKRYRDRKRAEREAKG